MSLLLRRVPKRTRLHSLLRRFSKNRKTPSSTFKCWPSGLWTSITTSHSPRARHWPIFTSSTSLFRKHPSKPSWTLCKNTSSRTRKTRTSKGATWLGFTLSITLSTSTASWSEAPPSCSHQLWRTSKRLPSTFLPACLASSNSDEPYFQPWLTSSETAIWKWSMRYQSVWKNSFTRTCRLRRRCCKRRRHFCSDPMWGRSRNFT